ncbi:MAG: S41 family peptidase [Patescibacteria group bacterium]|nr:S41 family peptidase [Patescibacteria group bacterium]MDD5715117.1 S41 family peptidase [Patescibacteria group bacterium]
MAFLLNKKPAEQKSGIGRMVIIAIAVFFVIISFSVGFYYGSVKTLQKQYNLSVGDILTNAGTFITDKSVDTDLFWEVWQSLNTRFINRPLDEKQLFYGAVRGMVASVNDPYSVFLDPAETVSFEKELSGTFEGIGAELGIKKDQLTIISVLPDTPAAKAGLRDGDRILKIDDTETAQLPLDEAVGLIRGEKGTHVILTVIQSGSNELKEIDVTRDVVNVESVQWSIKGTVNNPIAYVSIVHFTSETYNDFQAMINDVIVKNPVGMVLDLRNNPGGYLDTAIQVAGEFLEEEVIVIEDTIDAQHEYRSESNARLREMKLVVLVDGGSASAAEIVAGALQDHGRAVIIGEKTYGKGTVQDYEQFTDGSSLKLSIARWLTPLGRSIQDEGIAPDVVVQLTEEDYNNDRDPQLDAAMQQLLDL